MIGGDELSDFSCDADFAYLDVALIEDLDDDLIDDGVASYTASPALYDGFTVVDGLPNLESRQR
ncbi:MAG: hypothetical protein RLZZ627_434 [Pseudomonadota bacterium]|jgi:hypothetical protein